MRFFFTILQIVYHLLADCFPDFDERIVNFAFLFLKEARLAQFNIIYKKPLFVKGFWKKSLFFYKKMEKGEREVPESVNTASFPVIKRKERRKERSPIG